MNFQRKFFFIISFIIVVLMLNGCALFRTSSFFYPWQQIECYNDSQVKILKDQMTKGDIVGLIKSYFEEVIRIQKRSPNGIGGTYYGEPNPEIYSYLPWENLVVNEEKISHDELKEKWVLIKKEATKATYKLDNTSRKTVTVKYIDVKKIKLYECTLADFSHTYLIILYGETDQDRLCQFQFPRKTPLLNAQRWMAGFSLLIPHAKEDYKSDRYMLLP